MIIARTILVSSNAFHFDWSSNCSLYEYTVSWIERGSAKHSLLQCLCLPSWLRSGATSGSLGDIWTTIFSLPPNKRLPYFSRVNRLAEGYNIMILLVQKTILSLFLWIESHPRSCTSRKRWCKRQDKRIVCVCVCVCVCYTIPVCLSYPPPIRHS